MEKALEAIFTSVRNDLDKNLEADKKGTLPDSSNPVDFRGGDTKHFTFRLDKSGNYHYAIDKKGWGKTVHFDFWIDDPAATYSIKVGSSDGGGGHWDNVNPKQKCTGNLQTSFWHGTKISIDIHANVVDVVAHGTLQYTY